MMDGEDVLVFHRRCLGGKAMYGIVDNISAKYSSLEFDLLRIYDSHYNHIVILCCDARHIDAYWKL